MLYYYNKVFIIKTIFYIKFDAQVLTK